MTTVAVIDYGMGNLRSVCKALEHVAPKARIQITTDPDFVAKSDRVVFPGQGAIGGCVQALETHGLRPALLQAIKTKPFLGLCLGLQALYDYCEEDGGTPGLSVLSGRVPKFPAEAMQDADSGLRLKVPHMGWNQVMQVKPHPLWRGIDQNTRFYFVHSYYVEAGNRREVAGITEYGMRFTSAAARDNLFAVQFHPEKSQKPGLKLLENFVTWDGNG